MGLFLIWSIAYVGAFVVVAISAKGGAGRSEGPAKTRRDR